MQECESLKVRYVACSVYGRIDTCRQTGSRKKTIKKHSPRTLGTRVSCETGTRLDVAKGKTDMGLDEYSIHGPTRQV